MHKEIELNFLLAGHTKFSCDDYFGLLKKKFQHNRVSFLSPIEQVHTISNTNSGLYTAPFDPYRWPLCVNYTGIGSLSCSECDMEYLIGLSG